MRGSENLRIIVKCTLFVHLPGKIPYPSSVHFTQLLYRRYSNTPILTPTVLPSGRVMMTSGGCAATYVITLPVTAHKKGPFSVVGEGIEFCCVFTHTTTSKNHPLTMSNAPKPVEQSHAKQRCNVARLTMAHFLFVLPMNHWQRMSMLSRSLHRSVAMMMMRLLPALCLLFRHPLVAPLALHQQLLSIRWLIALLHERITKKQVLPLLRS